MWLTGGVFFLFTFLESYLWVFPFFRNNVIKDMTIQWKSYGSMVGAWNMLIYGSGIYLMEKISDKKTYSQSSIAFILYFTGLFNLMFNWGHHIYTLPTHHFIQYISYTVSMTELFIFGRIIWTWRSTVSDAKKHFYQTTYRFIIGADVWIFLVLLQAILMSIPAMNVYTHGTHITVAHTMGATIGINSMMLLAFTVDLLSHKNGNDLEHRKWINRGFWIVQISLFIFWISLIMAGVVKAKWQMGQENSSFTSMMQQSKPFFIVFCVSGVCMTIGFCMILFPFIGTYIKSIRKKK
jgi:nitric oxide reductase subunit B